MKSFDYAIRRISRKKLNFIIHVFTLAVGIVAGLVLIAKISFEYNYDRWIPEVRNLYQIQSLYTLGVGSGSESTQDYNHTLQPVAPTAAVEIPGIEAGTSIYEAGECPVFRNKERYEADAIYADTSFFLTMGLKILQGKATGLEKGKVFISESLSEKIFGSSSPVGETVSMDKAMSDIKTIAGVFIDIPHNSHISFDIILSSEDNTGISNSWDYGDGFTGYIRLEPETDPGTVSRALPVMMERHMDLQRQSELGYTFSAYLKPVQNLHTDTPQVKKTLLILCIITILLFIAAALNHVLASLSSFSSRAREIAILECNGASSRDIFLLILCETAIFVSSATAVSIAIIFLCGNFIENLTEVPREYLFSWENIACYIFAAVAVTAIAGLFLARIFSSVSAKDIFRFSFGGKRGWKNLLLFVQLACSAFVLGVLTTAVLQYRLLVSSDMGYETDNLAYCQFRDVDLSERAVIRDELMRLPCVSDVSFSSEIPVIKFFGMQLIDPATNETAATCRYTFADTSFLSTLGISLCQGSNYIEKLTSPAQALVNRRFLKVLGYDESYIGTTLHGNDMTIVGIIDDFTLGSAVNEQEAVCILPLPEDIKDVFMTVRLDEMTQENLLEVEAAVNDVIPENDTVFCTYRYRLFESFHDIKLFKDIATVSFAIIFLISIIHLAGYVSDEMCHRRKSIAICKIHGASPVDIIKESLRFISVISIPAVLTGLAVAGILISYWLQYYPERIDPDAMLFSALGVSMIGIVLVLSSAFILKYTYANPIESIRQVR